MNLRNDPDVDRVVQLLAHEGAFRTHMKRWRVAEEIVEMLRPPKEEPTDKQTAEVHPH